MLVGWVLRCRLLWHLRLWLVAGMGRLPVWLARLSRRWFLHWHLWWPPERQVSLRWFVLAMSKIRRFLVLLQWSATHCRLRQGLLCARCLLPTLWLEYFPR